MKKVSLLICLLFVSISWAANDFENLPGTIQPAGIDRFNPFMANSLNDDAAMRLRDKFNATYAALNELIPSRGIIVAPGGNYSELGPVTKENVTSLATDYFNSCGLMSPGFDLKPVSAKFVLDKIWFVNFQKTLNDLPIEDEAIGMAINPWGKVNMIWGNFGGSPIATTGFALSAEAAYPLAIRGLSGEIDKYEYMGKVIYPIYLEGRTEYHPAFKFMIGTLDPVAEWEVIVDAVNGELLERQDKIYYDVVSGDVSGTIQQMYPTDPWVSRQFFHMNMQFVGYEPIPTDIDGHYSIDIANSNPLDVFVNFSGPYLEVLNDMGENAEVSANVDPPTTFNVHWDYSNSTPPERDAWYHGVFVHNWISTLDPGLGVMDFPMGCHVNVLGSCNAFWSGWTQTINFYRAAGRCSNIAQIADVVYHEYGHGITDLQTRPFGPDGAMHEGFSDYIACTITDQPLVGRGFYSDAPNQYLRNLDNDLRYPEDWHGESHDDGRIIGGALWDLRGVLSPYPMGYTDTLWHFARYALTDNFEDYFWAFVLCDDDDGDVSNGTPNDLEIFHAFGDLHGIGPGTLVAVDADSLYDCEDSTRTYTINASISSFYPIMPDSVILYYNVGGGYIPLPMTFANGLWSATIPAQPNNTRIDYYVLAINQVGFPGTAPVGAPENCYTFFVRPDVIPPTITLLNAPPHTVNLFGPYGPFVISAWDVNDITASQVWMYYRINSETERRSQVAAGANEHEFLLQSLDLERQLETYDTLHYYFTAMDSARNRNVGRLPAAGDFVLAMTTEEIFETFENNGLANWTAGDDWILRNDGFNSQHSLWYSNPNYPNNANSTITMNSGYDLSPYTQARVIFYRRNLLRSGDTCFVEATNNGGFNWTRVGALIGLVAPIYQPMECDISSVLSPGGHDYRIRFHFVSDAESTWVGAFFDNIGWSVTPTTVISENGSSLPREVSLRNYPNPFNPGTNILFDLPRVSDVRLEVFDILGRKVATLVDERMGPGTYNVTWNGTNQSGDAVSSGIYFYRLSTESDVRQEKMTLLR